MNRLGIIDWGIGGVSLYKLIKERIGDLSVTYLSDTGVTPYGKMTRPELVSRLNNVISYLKTCNVTHIVIGCNAASTGLPYLKDQGVKIEGVIDTAVVETVKLKPKRLGLIGGRRTVLSGVYRRAFAARGINIKQRIAQPLSGLIESGDVSSAKLKTECRRILTPLKNCSHILLACTHYPAIISVMKEYVSPNTIFIDPASGLVDRIRAFRLSKDGGDVFLTTGDSAGMPKAAFAAFGVHIDKARKIHV